MDAPKVQAFLLCDEATRDAKDGKYRVSGVFDMIAVRSLPAEHRSMEAYVRLRLPTGTHDVRIGFVVLSPSGTRSETEATVARARATFGTVEGSYRLQKFPITEIGTYVIQLIVNGEPVADYPVGIVEGKKPPDATLH